MMTRRLLNSSRQPPNAECGAVSGIFVIDVDIGPGKRGDRTLVDLVIANGGIGAA